MGPEEKVKGELVERRHGSEWPWYLFVQGCPKRVYLDTVISADDALLRLRELRRACVTLYEPTAFTFMIVVVLSLTSTVPPHFDFSKT